ELQFALSGDVGITLAKETQPDLILLDVLMPHSDGYQTCAQFKNDHQLQHIPIIFVTALSDFNDERYGLALGAVDYITKPIDIRIARLRIRNLLERERLKREVKIYRKHFTGANSLNQFHSPAIQHNSSHIENIVAYDPLTEVPNRNLLIQFVQQSIAHAQRFGLMCTICHLNLDDYKQTYLCSDEKCLSQADTQKTSKLQAVASINAANDNVVVDINDQLLVTIIQRLSTTLRQCDHIIRLDGNEFILLLNNIVSETECKNMLERVLTIIQIPITINDRSIITYPCLGVTNYPHDDVDIDDLIRHAEQAMCQAKPLIIKIR
ncbi:hypothetical protein TI05_17195, partial [Achromatium sp. WMS3]